jgi:ribosomal-protein-alanine N-acetyltransferase
VKLKGFTIKKMGIKDLDEILSMGASSPYNLWSKNMFISEIRNPFSRCFIIKMKENSKDHIIGFICFRNIVDESELLNIYVHPQYRHLGIGKKLMQFYIGFCNQKKIKTFYLEVNSLNQTALHFYQLFSYQSFAMRKKFYQGKFDAFLMVKKT